MRFSLPMRTLTRTASRPRNTAVSATDLAGTGLRRSGDSVPGLRRERTAVGFRYRDPGGRLVRDAATLARIRSLAIPPAWDAVWINPDPVGHLQAIGRDAKGRKQYRYHPGWRSWRDRAKYAKLTALARALPRIRCTVARDLKPPGPSRDRVLATVVRLLERTHIRVGNDGYARENGSFGLTTLRDGHAAIQPHRVAFRFRGKHGIQHDIAIEDPHLARLLADCRALPGHELFQYVDASGRGAIGTPAT